MCISTRSPSRSAYSQHLHRDMGDDSFDDIKGMALVCLGRDELLEDAEDGLHLTVGDEVARPASDDCRQQSHESRDVPLRFPEGWHEDRRNQGLVTLR